MEKGKELAKVIKELLKEGLTWTQIANKLDIPESTVRGLAMKYLYKK